MTDDTTPRLSKTEAIILRLLVRLGESYGLAMVNASEGALARGSIYVHLHRLDERGYVDSREGERPAPGGPARRLYKITGLGARVLAWREAGEALRSGALVPALGRVR